MELTEADAGGERTLALGDELTVRLAENATTGFRWQPVDLPDAVAVVEDGLDLPSARAGQGGVRVFRLRPATPGDYRLLFALGRSWVAAPERTVAFALRVT